MVPRSLLIAIATCACTPTLETELRGVMPIVPQDPLSTPDTLIRFALQLAVAGPSPAPGPRRVIFLASVPAVVTPQSLPPLDSVTFYILDSVEIQRLADRTSDLSYLRLFPPQIAGDSAMVHVADRLAIKRRTQPFVLLGGGGCTWFFLRREGAWTLDRTRGGCITL
jgi:hypothetical protein